MPPTPIDYEQPSKGISNRRLKWAFLIVGVTLLALAMAVIIPVGLYVRHQVLNMAIARRHIPVIQAKITGDPRFTGVMFSDFTKGDGSLIVEGQVATQADLVVLQQIVANTSPPVQVFWTVHVPSDTRPSPTSAPTTQRVFINSITFNENSFTVAQVDLRQSSIRLFWKKPNGSHYGSFELLRAELAASGKELLFVTNAGIFDPTHTPVGLHVEEGRTLTPLNLKDGEGNFFLKPNGVFFINPQGASIVDSTEYPTLGQSTSLAIQSGPLLLRNSTINSKFREESQNRKLRSGVGIVSSHHVVFVLSDQPLTFFQFAAFFKENLHCSDALYLDGEISQFGWTRHMPANPHEFAAMLAIAKQGDESNPK